MINVIKLRSLVDNKNLPVLTKDGEVSNYYVGAYKNKLSEIGFYLTEEQTTALNTFIEDGIGKGWIDYIKYFLPFIGDTNTPLAGAVPLIDSIDNYQMSVYTMEENLSNLFVYNAQGDIMSMGGPTITPSTQILKTPVKLSDMAGGVNVTACIGPCDMSTSSLSYFGVMHSKTSGNVLRAFRVNTDSRFGVLFRPTVTTENSTILNVVRPTALEMSTLHTNKKSLGFNMSYFKDAKDGKVYYLRYMIAQDKSFSNYDKGLSATFAINDIPDSEGYFNLNYGQTAYSCKIPIQSWGIFDYTIPRGLLEGFNAARFDLNVALGR